jgi:hypothetical protein
MDASKVSKRIVYDNEGLANNFAAIHNRSSSNVFVEMADDRNKTSKFFV